MQISSTHRPGYSTQASAPKLANGQAKPSDSEFSTSPPPSDGWVGASISVLGGAAAVYGAATGNTMLVAGGALVTAGATTAAAWRHQTTGAMDAAAITAFSGVGLVATAAAMTLFGSPVVPATQNIGPLPQLIDKLGLRGLQGL